MIFKRTIPAESIVASWKPLFRIQNLDQGHSLYSQFLNIFAYNLPYISLWRIEHVNCPSELL